MDMDTTSGRIWLSDGEVALWQRDDEAGEAARRRIRARARASAKASKNGRTVEILNQTGDVVLDTVGPS
jgi:hypothetical protein